MTTPTDAAALKVLAELVGQSVCYYSEELQAYVRSEHCMEWWNPFLHIEDAFQVIEALRKRGLMREYAQRLVLLVTQKANPNIFRIMYTEKQVWAMLCAKPEQISAAASAASAAGAAARESQTDELRRVIGYNPFAVLVAASDATGGAE